MPFNGLSFQPATNSIHPSDPLESTLTITIKNHIKTVLALHNHEFSYSGRRSNIAFHVYARLVREMATTHSNFSSVEKSDVLVSNLILAPNSSFSCQLGDQSPNVDELFEQLMLSSAINQLVEQ